VYPFVLISETILDLGGVTDVKEADVVAGSMFVDVPLTGMPEGFAILENTRDLGVGRLTISCSNPQKYNEMLFLLMQDVVLLRTVSRKENLFVFWVDPAKVKIFFGGRVLVQSSHGV
jgi:hypothetical protein